MALLNTGGTELTKEEEEERVLMEAIRDNENMKDKVMKGVPMKSRIYFQDWFINGQDEQGRDRAVKFICVECPPPLKVFENEAAHRNHMVGKHGADVYWDDLSFMDKVRAVRCAFEICANTYTFEIFKKEGYIARWPFSSMCPCKKIREEDHKGI